jgi:hypothetical protein
MSPDPTPERPSAIRRHLPPIAVLTACVVAFFAPVFLGASFSSVPSAQNNIFPWGAFNNGQSPFSHATDQAQLNLPWQGFMANTWRSGEIPFWNPYSFGGQPFFSNGSSGVFYPLRVAAVAVSDPHRAYDFLSVAHVLLGAWCFYALMIELGCGRAGSVLGALAWSMSSFVLGWLHLEVVAPIAVVLPAVALLSRRYLERPSSRRAAAAAAAIAVGLSAGHVLFMAAAVGGGLVFALASGNQQSGARAWRAHGRRAAGAILILGLGLMLAAPVLVPTAKTVADSPRQAIALDHALNVNPVPLAYLRGFFGAPPMSHPDPLHELAYVGWVPLLLAAVGLARRRPGRGAALALVVGVLSLVFGGPLLALVYRAAPSLTLFRPTGRLFFLSSFGLAVLAAWGLDAISHWQQRVPWRRAAPWVAAAAIAATAIDLGIAGRRINPPFVPRENRFFFPRTPLLQALARTQEEAASGWVRIAPIGQPSSPHAFQRPVLLGSIPMLFALDSLGGYDSVIPRLVLVANRVLEGVPLEHSGYGASYRSWFLTSQTRVDLLTRLGVTHLVLTPGAHDDANWRLRLAAAHVEVKSLYQGRDGEIAAVVGEAGGPVMVCAVEFASSPRAASTRFLATEFPFRAAIVIEHGLSSPPIPDTCRAEPVRVTKRTTNSLELAVGGGGGWLWVPESWDAGWRAWVDGAPAPVVRANGFQQAVWLPRGAREVRLEYRPDGLREGVLALAAGLALLLTGAVVEAARARTASDRLGG